MNYYITVAEAKNKKYYRGQYKTYNNAINYGLKDLEKMADAVKITGNRNNIKVITLRVYSVIDEKRSRAACYIAHKHI
jgi:hypothetical protein